MNRVYKVIWSKAKNCYVVTSEIARSVTKSASSARSAGRKGAAVLAMTALLFTAGGVLGEAADQANLKIDEHGVVTMVKDDSNQDVNKLVLKVDGDNQITMDKDGIKVGKNNTVIGSDGTIKGANERFTVGADGKVTAASGIIGTVDITSAGAVSGVMDLTVNRDVEANGNLRVGNGNFTVYGNTGNVTTGYATIGDDLTVKGDTEMKGDLGVNGNIKTNGGFIRTGGGNINTQGGALRTNGGNINAGSGTITGGAIKGTTGSFANEVSAGSVKVTNKLEAGSIESTGSIEAKGNLKGDSLTVTNNASVGGQLTAGTLAVAGNNFTVGADGNVVAAGVNAGAGTIKTTGAVETGALHATGNATVDGNTEIKGTLKAGATTVDSLDAGSGLIKTNGTVKAGDVQTGTLTTTGNVTIGGALTVTGKLNMDEIDMNKNGIVGDDKVDANTKVAAGKISSYKKAISQTDGSEKESAINYNENGTSTWAKATDADGKWNKSTLTVEGKGIKSIATDTDGKNKASTNLSNNGFNTFASDGTNKTYTKQTATDIKNTAEKGMISHTAKNLVNRAYENMTNTVGKNLTTTVGGDSSLTAENITNEAKNKITNKALDVETDAASSIVSKVSNDYGSNTSTQLSHQTMEEMKAEGKTASYLRGAAEEKSQLTDGAKKTTIDTVAGQTNTNITEGKNVSNSLQKADQIASSVTDGTNTTVVNQNAGSLASSITDGPTKFNNSIHWVDGSAQRIEVDDTHFYAETRTAEKAEEALKSGNTVIDIVKDTNTATVSSAVFDDTTNTGISQNAKDISLSAAGGTITNDANDVLNKGANSVINKVGDNKVAIKTDRVKVAYGSDTYTTWNDKGITSKTGGNMSNSATNITNSATEKLSNSAADIKNSATESITDKVGENVKRTMTTNKISESVKDDAKSNSFSKTAERDINIITDGTKTSTESQLADSVNTSLKEVDGKGKTTKSLNNVKTVSEDTTKMTDAASGEFSKRSQTVSQIQDKVGKTTVTTIDGKTKLTDEDHNHTTEMDYANVTKDLSVERDTTLGKKGEHTNLTVNSKSEFEDTVKMDSTLEVDGTSKFNDKVTITKNGLDVKDGTTTDTLTVTGTSEFRGKADFKDNVSMGKGLAVAGETKTGTLHVEKDGYVGGNLNVAGNIETHDAVLSADSRQVVTGRQLYQTNERVDRLDNRIKKVGANAAALAALRPGDFNPDDKFSIAAGFGSYRNANAAALGLFYRPNENVLLSLGTSFGDGENMVNAGVSVKFGRGKSMAERRKEMADEVSSMRDEMRSQDERIAELEEMLKKQSELIEKLSKES